MNEELEKSIDHFLKTYEKYNHKLQGGFRFSADSMKKIALRMKNGEEQLFYSFEDRPSSFTDPDYWDKETKSILTGFRMTEKSERQDTKETVRKMFGTQWGNLGSHDKRLARNSFGEDVTKYFDE